MEVNVPFFGNSSDFHSYSLPKPQPSSSSSASSSAPVQLSNNSASSSPLLGSPDPPALEGPPPPCPIPVLTWNSSNSVLIDKMLAAGKVGVMLLTDLNVEAPMVGIRETFCKLYEEPELVNEQLNKLHPIRGLFKHKGYLDKKHIDQKAVLDLTHDQIEKIQLENLPLGQDFNETVVPFYHRVNQEIIPRLKYLSAFVLTGGIGVGMECMHPAAEYIMNIHSENNLKLRLIDFYPVHKTRNRCGAHRDFATFTLIFQDKQLGGMEVLMDGQQWVPVPVDAEAVLLWGWSALILSNNRVQAPLHRVVPLRTNQCQKAARRNEAVFYVAPDWNALLHPTLVYPTETLKFNVDAVKNLTVREFKNLFEMKWHKREGTITEQERNLLTALRLDKKRIDSHTQDDDILDFLLGARASIP